MKYPSVRTLLKDLDCVQNTNESTRLSLNVLFESINRLKCGDQEVLGICRDFACAVKTSRPGNTPLAHLLDFFEHDIKDPVSVESGCAKQFALDSLEEKIDQLDRYGKYVAENGLSYVKDGDTIFVLQSDKVIEDILIQAKKELGRRFKVVVLDCCGSEACRTTEVLTANGIDVLSLPASSPLTDYMRGAVRLFMGGMAVTADRKIMAPADTSEVVDLCRSRGGRVHLFASSLWYSRQRSTDRCAFNDGGTQDFALAVTPGDLVCLNSVDHIVTEFGEVGPDGRLIVPPVSLARLKAIDARAAGRDNDTAQETAAEPSMSAA